MAAQSTVCGFSMGHLLVSMFKKYDFCSHFFSFIEILKELFHSSELKLGK